MGGKSEFGMWWSSVEVNVVKTGAKKTSAEEVEVRAQTPGDESIR